MRPSRENILMSSAYLWATRSTCDRLHVGAVVHREGRILVQGYNGAPAGMKHCDHTCNCYLMLSRGGRPYSPELLGHGPQCPSQQPCTRAVHAEQNAISFAARWGVGLEGAEMSVTHQPCLSCAMSIVNAGIKSVAYVEPYRLIDGLSLLLDAGIEVRQDLAPQLSEVIGSSK